MQNIILINPLKSGKLDAYKIFMAEITTDRKDEYIDMLTRYGLKNSKVYYQHYHDAEFVVVSHEAEPDAMSKLPGYATSTHPFDVWFKEQAGEFYDLATAKAAGHAQLVMSFDINE